MIPGRIAVVGIGLMGGSLCMAVRKKSPGTYIWACDSDQKLVEKARALQIADEISCSMDDLLEDVDMIVLCTPLGATYNILQDIARAEMLGPGVVITDVGSAKSELAQFVQELDLEGNVILSHPMAGSEQSGLDAARQLLYDDAVVFITPIEGQDTTLVRQFWETLGSRVVQVDPDTHDRLTAFTSHMPHMLSSALARVVHQGAGDDENHLFRGTGFESMTRLAAGNPRIWKDVVLHNSMHISRAIGLLIDELEIVKRAIDDNDQQEVYQFLEEAARWKGGFS